MSAAGGDAAGGDAAPKVPWKTLLRDAFRAGSAGKASVRVKRMRGSAVAAAAALLDAAGAAADRRARRALVANTRCSALLSAALRLLQHMP